MATDAFDRAFLGFMIATGARSMGMDVEIFFALWGLNLLRRKKGQPGLPPDESSSSPAKGFLGFMQKMMKMMMPRGPDEAKLSQMNFAGLGPKMMKEIMREKNITSLPEMMDLSVESGIQFTVCSMTMEILGLRNEDLLDLPNLKLGGIVSCIGEAIESKMFIVI